MKNLILISFMVFYITSCNQKTESIKGKKYPRIDQLKSFGTSGKAVYPFKGANEAELYSFGGKGCLTHMWFGGLFNNFEKLRIRVYVDNEAIASIDMELFLGHGIGFEDETAPWGTKRIGKTGNPSGVYNNYYIPFGKSIRITAQLPEGDNSKARFWYILRGTENFPVTFAGVQFPDNARLKLHKLEDHVAEPLEEFDIYKTSRSGLIYQVTVAARSTKLVYMESMVRGYTNDSDSAILLSSGLEDYFLGTYSFKSGLYHTESAGLTHLDKDNNSFSAYRFHEEDPLYFQNGFRLTLRCGEETKRETWKADTTIYTTYVWAYEW